MKSIFKRLKSAPAEDKRLPRVVEALIAAAGVGAILCAWRMPAAIQSADESILRAERTAAWARQSVVQRGALLVLEVPADVEPEYEEPGEALYEDQLIESALSEQGYLRDDVPLSYVLQEIVHSACEEFGVDYALALGLIEVESGFRADAVNSVTGCYGLCQLSPAYFPAGLSPEENVRAGVAYLGQCLERYDGDVGAALTAYNAGHDDGSRRYAAAVLEAAGRWSG